MKWLVLLALIKAAAASNFELGDRIVATKEECDRILKLNNHWRTSNFNEEAAQYVDLYFNCQDSLNEDKYAYIDENKVDMSWYPGENEKFPVFTSQGEKYVTKPPPRKPRDEESMKKRLAEYLTKAGGKLNPIYRLMSVQSEMGQAIINKQVECEVLALYMLNHPDDKDSETQHTDCMTKLNCLKERFMEQHKFTKEHYPDYFPILYKRRGTMIKTPPQVDNSNCERPDSPEGNKRELEKWMSGIEFIGEKIADFGEAGTDFIEKLVKKGMGGGDKVLTRSELDDIMTDVQSIEISDDDGEDDEDDEHTYKVYGDIMLSKLAELEAKGIQIAHAQIEKAKPAIENLASATGEKLQNLEESKIKPAIKKTMQGLSQAEYNLKEKSKSAFEEAKGGVNAAGSIAKSKAKGETSVLMSKLMSKPRDNLNNEGPMGLNPSDTTQNVLSTLINRMIHPEYLPDNYGDTHSPSLIKILKEMGGHDEDGKDKLSDDELKKMLKSLKESTKKKAQAMNLNKEEIIQSAEVVKGVMHALLYAGSYGYGAAKDMSPQEIEKAKSLVDELVDYATAEILDEDDGKGEEEEDDEAPSDEGYAEDNHLILKKALEATTDSDMQETSTSKSASEHIISEENNTNPTVNPDSNKPTSSNPEEAEGENESRNESDNSENNKEITITDEKQEVSKTE